MQRQNTLRVDDHATTTTTARTERIVTMRARALFAALSNQRPDLLQQLLAHLGNRTFAETLGTLSAQEQVAALRMLSSERRAAVFRELSQPQREIWHQASQREMRASRSLLVRCRQLLRAPRTAIAAMASKTKNA